MTDIDVKLNLLGKKAWHYDMHKQVNGYVLIAHCGTVTNINVDYYLGNAEVCYRANGNVNAIEDVHETFDECKQAILKAHEDVKADVFDNVSKFVDKEVWYAEFKVGKGNAKMSIYRGNITRIDITKTDTGTYVNYAVDGVYGIPAVFEMYEACVQYAAICLVDRKDQANDYN